MRPPSLPLITAAVALALLWGLLYACVRGLRSAREEAWRMRHEYERVPLRTGSEDANGPYRPRAPLDPRNLYHMSVSDV